MEPFEVQDPGDTLTHNPEVVPEKYSTHDVNGVLTTSDQKPTRTENNGSHGPEGKLDTSDALEFAENDNHEAKVVTEKVVVLMSEGLYHQGVHPWELPK